MNAFGNLSPGQANGNAFGLQVVVDRNFTESTLIVGDPSGFEIFEQQKGAMATDGKRLEKLRATGGAIMIALGLGVLYSAIVSG